MEYEFTLKFKLAADGGDSDKLVQRLGQAGCNEALVGTGQRGRMALNFTRQADSAQTAMVSALIAVKTVIPQAELLEAGPDFVGLTEVAEWVGVSRQNMRKLMLAHWESFPAPVHEGSAACWHLAPVLQWLTQRGTYQIEPTLLDVAHFAMQINLAKEAGHLDSQVRREIRALVA